MGYEATKSAQKGGGRGERTPGPLHEPLDLFLSSSPTMHIPLSAENYSILSD